MYFQVSIRFCVVIRMCTARVFWWYTYVPLDLYSNIFSEILWIKNRSNMLFNTYQIFLMTKMSGSSDDYEPESETESDLENNLPLQDSIVSVTDNEINKRY